MSVLRRKELEESPLADLHTIASELGLEGFRAKRKSDLIDSILAASGSGGEAREDDGFSGLPGVTSHQMRSSRRRFSAKRPTWRCPACGGLKEPP